MGRPKGSKNKRDESAAVPEPGVSEERREAPVGIERSVHRDLQNLPDGPRSQPDASEGSGQSASDGASPARGYIDGEGEAGQEDICLTDWNTISLPDAEVALQTLRDNLEKAANIVQSRITAEASSTCAYCGKIIVDHAKAFSRMTNRNPKTGILVTTDVCTEQCYRGYRARETNPDISYATT